MSWFAAALPIAVAVAVVFVPGLAVTTALRLRGLPAIALAGPAGFASIGVAGVLFGLAHVPFGWWAPLLIGLAAAGVVLAARVFLHRASRPAWAPIGTWAPARTAPVVAGILVGSVAIAVIAFGAVPSPERISQTYDAVFHLNAVASIMQHGDASSLTLYVLTHPTQHYSFYPAVWHSIAAVTAEVTGVPIPVAADAAWIATAGPVWAAGCAFAASTLLGRVGPRRWTDAQPVVIATVAAVLSSAFAAFPYLLLDFGTLYPNGLATTLLPTGLALVALVLPWSDGAPWRPVVDAVRLPWVRILVLLGIWLVGAVFSHPRSMVGLAAIGLPLLLAWFVGRTAATWSLGRRRRAVLAWVALGVAVLVAAVLAYAVLYHVYDLAHRPIADHLNGAPARARESFPAALAQGLLGTTLASPAQQPLPVPLLLAAVVVAGLIALLVRRGVRWIVVGYVLIALLYAAAAGSNSDLAKLATGLWDKDKFRIIAIAPTLAVPIAAWVITAGALAIAARRVRVRIALALPVVIGLLVSVSAWAGDSLGDMRESIGTVFSLPASDKSGLLLDADEVALLSRIGRTVPAGQLVVDDPWNGTALAWAFGGRQTLFPHLGGYWGDERKLIAAHLGEYGSNPAVCRAVRSFQLHWLVTDSQKLWGGRPEDKAYRGIDAMARSKGVTLADSQGSTKLYRITACW